MVKPGDVVRKGDILVSGIVEVTNDFGEIINKKPVIASADIECSSYYDYYDAFSMTYTVKIFTGKKKTGYYVTVFGKKIILYNPRYSYDMYDIIVNENTVRINESFYLPIRYGTITVREYYKQRNKYSESEAIDLAKERINRYFSKLSEKGVSITRNNVKTEIIDNMCVSKGRIHVLEPAWEYRIVDESEWRINRIDEHNGNNN